jgi:hypothetical protein
VGGPSVLAAYGAVTPGAVFATTVGAAAGVPGVLYVNPYTPGGVAGVPVPTGSFQVPGTAGATAPIPGFGGASIALTGVGVPAAFIAGTAPGLPAGVAGRPIFINEFIPNTANFNTDNAAGVARPSYNLVVGSNRSLGGNVYSAPTGIATGGNPFTGLTGMPGVSFATPLVLPTFEVRTGRPWTQGTGWSGQGILGVRIKLNPDMDAGAEFAAYYSTGDPIVDAFYGVSAVRQANVFASNQSLAAGTGVNAGLQLDGGQGADNSPWNRMVIDNFWFLHKPSNIKVQLGSFGDTHMDSIVYQPEYNPNYYGPRYLDNYGFRISGKHHLLAPFEWEVFGTNVADGNRLVTNFPAAVAAGATPYKPYLWGVDGKWTFGQEGNQGRFKFNLMRIWDDNAAGQALTVGSVTGVNGVWMDWANPNGYYAGQLSPQFTANLATATTNPNAGRVAGIGSTSDVRPIIPNIAGNGGGLAPAGGVLTAGTPLAPTIGIDQTASGVFGATTEPLLAALGAPVSGGLPTSSFGPQSMFTWGLSGGWDYSWNDNIKMRFFGEYADSDYKPSANSAYHAPDGNAWRVGLGFTLFSDFDIDGEYIDVNPYYNPYVLQYPNVNGVTEGYWRIPSLSWFPEMYPVSDKDIYPNNREGFRVNLKWNPVDPKDGKHKTVFYGEYGNMQQEQTSLQSIRYSPGSIALGSVIPGSGVAGIPTLYDPNSTIPNGFVLGNNPGFVDTIFTGFHPTSFAGFTGSFAPSSVNQFATPLENPRGRVTNWGLGLNYRFDSLGGLGIHAGYKDWSFRRTSGLAPAFGGSENNIDLRLNGGLVALNFPINERFSIKGGYAWTSVRGHYDPTGVYRNFALDTGDINFQTFNQDQTSPFVGFDYDVAKNVNWNMTAKWLDSHDNLGTFSTPTFYLNRNPFSWSGLQITSQVKVSF